MNIVRHFRSFRGGRRNSGARPVTRSYKKILNILEAGYAAGDRGITLVTGVDALAAGQTSNTDGNVPTGCIIRSIEIQFSLTNVTAANIYVNTAFLYLLSGQSVPDPKALGGNTLRSQVLHQSQNGIGTDQNFNRTFRMKIPAKFQRVKEGQRWIFAWANNASVNAQTQIIYKFYQ